MLRQKLLVTGLVLLAGTAACAQGRSARAETAIATAASKPGADVRTKTLKNGLKVIVWPDHGHPQRRALQLVPRGQPQRAPRHHRALPLLRAHDVQRREEVRPRASSTACMEAARRPQQRLHHRGRHRVPGLVPALGAGDRLRPGGGPHRPPRHRPQGRGERARRRLLGAPLHRGQRQHAACSWSRCRPPPSSRTPTRFPVIGWPSDIERWTQEDLESATSAPTTRPTTPRSSWRAP